VQAPVTLAAVVRTGSWVIPLVALLAVILGALGVALLWPQSYSWVRRPGKAGQP
jgi:hypothetical protein